MSASLPEPVLDFLRRSGLAAEGEAPNAEALSGGVSSDIWRVDLAFLDDLTLRLLERYNPAFVGLLPPPLDAQAAGVFGRCGILPYDEHDWDELAVMRGFLETHLGQYFPGPDG